DHPGEQRRFGEGEIPRRFAEIVSRRGAYAVNGAVSILAEVDLVEISLEDRPLVIAQLEDQRDGGLAKLAEGSPSGGEEEVLGQLLGQGAAALHHGAGAQVGDQRAADPAEVEAVVLEESLVLDGEHRLNQVVRQVTEGDWNARFHRGAVEGAQDDG